MTQRSSIEQQLLVRSLARAVARLDSERYIGERVHLALFTLTDGNVEAFATQFVKVRLAEQGVCIVSDGEVADLQLTIFASVLSVDQRETLIGLPSFIFPVVGTTVPELALYKSVQNQGQTQLQIYAFDSHTGSFVGKTAISVGQAAYDQYKILVVINFTISDISEQL